MKTSSHVLTLTLTLALAGLAAGCGKSSSPASTTTTTSADDLKKQVAAALASAADPVAAAAPASTTIAKIALGGSLKGYSVDAPEGAAFEPGEGMIRAGERFAFSITKGKVDLAEQKKNVKRDLQEVAIVAEDPSSFIYEFASIGKNYGFRANVKVGNQTYWCMSDFGFYGRSDMDAMLKSCQSLAKAK